jgi:hypothetical protein
LELVQEGSFTMKQNQKTVLIVGVVAVAGSALFLNRGKIMTQIKPIVKPLDASGLRKKAVTVAREHHAFWAGRSELHAGVQARLLSYWMKGGNMIQADAQRAIKERLYWSAVFISTVIKESGAGNTFKYSAAHTIYCAAAKRNRIKKNNQNPFWLYQPSEVAPRLGDIICNARANSGVTFANVDDGNSRASHCDIVVGVKAGYLEVIGGNLGDTVSLKTVRINSKGLVIDSDVYAILQVGRTDDS